MSAVQEYFYNGIDIILQVYGEEGFSFRGFMFFDTGNGVTTERVSGDNKTYRTVEDALAHGFEHIKQYLDGNLTLN